MNSVLDSAKIIICVGTGGVGKTTIAAGLGCYAAEKGLKVLVLTIDPAKRLAQALGLSSEIVGDVLVPGQNYSGKLYAGLIDPQRSFDDFIVSNSENAKSAETILNNTLYKQLSTNLSGSQEFTSLDRLYRSVKSEEYDLVILDTPPAQNAMDFFSAPEKLYALFQKSITRWFISDKKDRGFFSKVINKGTLTVLSALEKLTGAVFIRELANFFTSVQGVQEVIIQRSMDVQKMLVADKTQFVLVSSFDKVKIREAESIYQKLKMFGFNLYAIIINRYFDQWEGVEQDLEALSQKFNEFYKTTDLEVENIEKQLNINSKMIRIENATEELIGLQGLSIISKNLERGLDG